MRLTIKPECWQAEVGRIQEAALDCKDGAACSLSFLRHPAETVTKHAAQISSKTGLSSNGERGGASNSSVASGGRGRWAWSAGGRRMRVRRHLLKFERSIFVDRPAVMMTMLRRTSVKPAWPG